MKKFLILAPLFLAVFVLGSALAQNRSRHRKHKPLPVGTGTSAISWEPEEGSAFLVYTRKLPTVTKIELHQITKHDGQVQILSSKTLLGDDAEQFANLWRHLKRGSGAACFVPAYNVKFYSGESLVLDTEVCFGCDNLTLPNGASNKQWGFDGNGPEGQALLSALKTLLSPMAQQIVGRERRERVSQLA